MGEPESESTWLEHTTQGHEAQEDPLACSSRELRLEFLITWLLALAKAKGMPTVPKTLDALSEIGPQGLPVPFLNHVSKIGFNIAG